MATSTQLYGNLCGTVVVLSDTSEGAYPIYLSDEPSPNPVGYHTEYEWQLQGQAIYQVWSFKADETDTSTADAINARIDELEAALVEVADTIGGTDGTAAATTTEEAGE
jgi:hypothetical protein